MIVAQYSTGYMWPQMPPVTVPEASTIHPLTSHGSQPAASIREAYVVSRGSWKRVWPATTWRLVAAGTAVTS